MACSIPLRFTILVGWRMKSSSSWIPSAFLTSLLYSSGGNGGFSKSITFGMIVPETPVLRLNWLLAEELIITCSMELIWGGKAILRYSQTAFVKNRCLSQKKSWWCAIVGTPISEIISVTAIPRGILRGIVKTFSVTIRLILNFSINL